MSKLDELNAKVDALCTAIVLVREENAKLREQLGVGVTDEQLQPLIEKIDAVTVLPA